MTPEEVANRLWKTLGLDKELIISALGDSYPKCNWVSSRGSCQKIQHKGHVFCKSHVSSAQQEASCITLTPTNDPSEIPHISEINSANWLELLKDLRFTTIKSKYLPELGLVKLSKTEKGQTLFLMQGDSEKFNNWGQKLLTV